MSIRVMSIVWERPDLDPYERLVMLCLADHSDDNGTCYPSIRRLCERTGMKDRGVQNVLKRLQDRGLLSVKMGGGRSGTNVYTVNVNPASDAPPAPDAPRTTCTTPPHPITVNPAPDAPKPSRTVKEPSVSKNTRMPEDAMLSQRHVEIAAEQGHDAKEAAAQFARFKSSAIANGRRYANWDAAWRNWFTSPYFKPITTGGQRDQPSSKSATRLDAFVSGARGAS